MGRIIGAVVVGYLMMAVLIFGTFTLAYLAMGADKAFMPASYDPSGLWLVSSFALGLLASIAGGFVCAAIAKEAKAAKILAGVALVLGLLMAIPALTTPAADPPKVRSSDAGSMDAMMEATQPAWVALLNPFVGAVGVLLGASFKRRVKLT